MNGNEEFSLTNVIYSSIIPKMSKDGKRQVGSLTIELKEFKGSRFIQLTQEKFSFKGQQPKRTCVTFNSNDEQAKKAVQEVMKL